MHKSTSVDYRTLVEDWGGEGHVGILASLLARRPPSSTRCDQACSDDTCRKAWSDRCSAEAGAAFSGQTLRMSPRAARGMPVEAGPRRARCSCRWRHRRPRRTSRLMSCYRLPCRGHDRGANPVSASHSTALPANMPVCLARCERGVSDQGTSVAPPRASRSRDGAACKGRANPIVSPHGKVIVASTESSRHREERRNVPRS